MIIEEIQAQTYANILSEFSYVYCTSEFNELNKYKVDMLRYLLFKNSKTRFVLCAGMTGNKLLVPFSAPFSMLIEARKETDIEYYGQAISALLEYAYANQLMEIQITLPPLFYDERSISLLSNSLYNMKFTLSQFDLNFHLDLTQVYKSNYAELLPRNGRKNLRIAQSSTLNICLCTEMEELKEAYRIIQTNRNSKDRPLRMSFDQMVNTMSIVPHEVFIVDNENLKIAAAFVFHINTRIAQVIYWGDIPGHAEFKTINFLAYKLIQYYGEHGFEFLDIGPSTENSIANIGLCDFKESIGCKISPKWTFSKLL